MSDIDRIPARPGAYVVEFHLEEGQYLTIGRLGQALFSPGAYLYMGSAGGPGGLRARLGRHMTNKIDRPHWHIDYLHQVARPVAYLYLTTPNSNLSPMPLECRWSQAITELPDAGLPLSGFGSSDCRSGCRAHLVHFRRQTTEIIFLASKNIRECLTQNLAEGSLSWTVWENR